jgi:hypothetical protein
MDIAGVFGSAWSLYERNVGWLIVAGIIAGTVSGGVILVFVALGGVAGYATFGGLSSSGSSGGVSVAGALGGMMLVMACGFLVAQLLVLVLQGGMLKMAIDSGRSGRGAQLGDLFAGFARLPAYLVFGLIAAFGVSAGCLLVFVVTAKVAPVLLLLALPVCFVLVVWLFVSWVYAVPLIADRGLSPIEALTRSREMVARVGWFSTFGLLLLVVILTWLISSLISAATALVFGRGAAASVLAMSVVDIVIMPYLVCYLASMYLGSESRGAAPVYGGSPSSGPGFGPYGGGPVVPAPFDPSFAGYQAPASFDPAHAGYAPAAPPPPASTPGGYSLPGVPPLMPAPPDRATESAAWANAADPLARPPAPSAPTRAPGAADPSWLSE